MTLLVAGLVRADAFSADLSGMRCEFCHWPADERGGYVHLALESYACARCLPNPGAEDVSEEGVARLAGTEAADRLAQRRRDEREAWPL